MKTQLNAYPNWIAMKKLASYTQIYQAGEIIFREDDIGSTAYIIERGKVDVSITRNGERLILAEYRDGDLFGEMALIDKTPRSATVTALEHTEVIAIERSLFEKAADTAHPLINLFMQTILHNLRKTNQLLLSHFSTPGYLVNTRKLNSKFYDARNETVFLVKAENELTRAIKLNEFQLYLQPIIDISNDSIAGFETLVRWIHPERGLIAPNEFIALAEQTGLIKGLGNWIIQEACQKLQTVCSTLPDIIKQRPDFFLSINLSARQFIFPDLYTHAMEAISKYNLSAHNIKFEITESILMDDPETATLLLDKFRQQGFRIAIDDFGTGYSSLSYLHRFPINTLKIDRSFILSMSDNPTSKNIVNAIIGLAKAIKLNVIAEGVETEAQLNDLKKLGCDFIQGFYYHKPMPFDEALGVLCQHYE